MLYAVCCMLYMTYGMIFVIVIIIVMVWYWDAV